MASKDLSDKVNYLEKERANLLDELNMLRQTPSGSVSYIFLNIGIIFILLSLVHTDHILASIGIALTFFGGFFLYIKPYQFVRKDVFDASFVESIENINSLLRAEKYLEKPRYASSGSLEGVDEVNLFFYKSNDDISGDINDVFSSTHENQLKIMPAGRRLSKLIRNELNKSLLGINLEYLVNNLENVIVESMGLTKSFSMEVKDDKIIVKLENTIFDYFYNTGENYLNGIYEVEPLTSSLACIFSITSQKSIYIDKIEWNSDNNVESVIFIMVRN